MEQLSQPQATTSNNKTAIWNEVTARKPKSNNSNASTTINSQATPSNSSSPGVQNSSNIAA
jgi:hypothetical protein